MARLGRFTDDAARTEYLRAYDAVAALWPGRFDDVDVPTTFGRTRVRTADGPGSVPYVLLHGFGGTGPSWYASVPTLAAARRVHAPDTIGAAGRSVQTAALRGDADLARWLEQVLDELGADRVHLVGESQGAWHATLAAVHLPERLASVSLVEPNGVFARTPARALLRMVRLGVRPSDDGWRRMGEWLTPGVELGPEMLGLARAAQGFRTGLGWARPLADRVVAGIEVPLLVVYGGDSVRSTPDRASERLARLAPTAEVHVYPGCGHGVLGEVREDVLARIVDFAGRHDRTGATSAA